MGSAERSSLGEHRERARDGNLEQGPESHGGCTIRVVIPRQQLTKLLAEGSIKKSSSSCKMLLPPSALRDNGSPCVDDLTRIIRNAMKMTPHPASQWSPRLDTITEAPLQLTRSPVITRNCEAVQHFLQMKTVKLPIEVTD